MSRNGKTPLREPTVTMFEPLARSAGAGGVPVWLSAASRDAGRQRRYGFCRIMAFRKAQSGAVALKPILAMKTEHGVERLTV